VRDVLELLGTVGTPADVAVFGYVVYEHREHIAPRLQATAAGIVALARESPGVDADALAREVDADPQDVRAFRADGGRRDE